MSVEGQDERAVAERLLSAVDAFCNVDGTPEDLDYDALRVEANVARAALVESEAREAVLVEALKEIAYPPHDVDEGWFIRRARTALAGDGPTPREAIAAYHSANGKRITAMMVYLRQAEIIQRGIEGICYWNGIEYDSEDVGRKARGILDAVLAARLPERPEGDCPNCKGTGRSGDEGQWGCSKCGGSGRLPERPDEIDERSTESEPARSLTFEEGERAREFLRERGWKPSGLAWIKEHGKDHAGDIFEALDKEKT